MTNVTGGEGAGRQRKQPEANTWHGSDELRRKRLAAACTPNRKFAIAVEMALRFALSPVQLLLHFVFVNMLNYVDRGVVAGVLPTLQTEFGLDSTQTGFLGSSFVISYMIFSLPFAQLAQRFSPFLLMGVGLGFWIGSAVVAYFSASFQMLLVARAPSPRKMHFYKGTSTLVRHTHSAGVMSGLGEASFQYETHFQCHCT
jgi:hypothetical protein